jgi:hypothetical protein
MESRTPIRDELREPKIVAKVIHSRYVYPQKPKDLCYVIHTDFPGLVPFEKSMRYCTAMDVPIQELKVVVFKKSKEIEIFYNLTKASHIQHMHEVLPGSIPSLDVDATRNNSLERHCRYA